MKKVILRIAILFAIFIGGVVGFSTLMNQNTTQISREMEEATLPVMCIDYNGYKINRMYGYSRKHCAMVWFLLRQTEILPFPIRLMIMRLTALPMR